MTSKEIRRIVLVNPFHVASDGYDMESVKRKGQLAEPPLGLAYISAFVKKFGGYEVKIFDANLMAIKGFTLGHYSRLEEVEDELISNIDEFNPDVVGIGCPFHFIYRTAHRIAGRIKKKRNGIITVMGGAYPTISPEVALKDENVDFIIIGEGEKAFLNLLEALNGRFSFDKLTAVGYRTNGQMVIKREFDLLESLENLSLPDRTDLSPADYYRYGRHIIQKFEDYEGKELKLTTITGTRGCPFNCSFCMSRQIWGRCLRTRNPESVLDEIEFLKREHGIEWFSFNDDTILLNRRFSRKLLRGIIERKLDIRWIPVAGMNVRYLDEEMITLAMESGCRMFNLGIESGSPQTLTTIRKPVNTDEVLRVVKMIRRHKNFYIAGFFMLGFPEETEGQFFETVRFGKMLACDWNFYACVTPFPGSDLYYEAKAKGMLPDGIEDDFEKFHYRSYILNPRYISNAFVTQESYFANLDQNFFENPNLSDPARVEIALSDFMNVIKLAPAHATAYYCIGRIHEARGEIELARRFYELARANLSGLNKKYFEKIGINI